MVLDIVYDNKTDTYNWNLYDGPDGIENYSGKEKTLGSCFEEIIKARYCVLKEYE